MPPAKESKAQKGKNQKVKITKKQKPTWTCPHCKCAIQCETEEAKQHQVERHLRICSVVNTSKPTDDMEGYVTNVRLHPATALQWVYNAMYLMKGRARYVKFGGSATMNWDKNDKLTIDTDDEEWMAECKNHVKHAIQASIQARRQGFAPDEVRIAA